MIKLLSTVSFAVLYVLGALAQNAVLTVRAFDGKTGRPLAHQRLLFFGGLNEQESRIHKKSFEVTTDADGAASLHIDLAKTRIFTVFADYMTMCSAEGKRLFLSSDTIIEAGFTEQNQCGSFAEKATPGVLVVYARKPTLREKMAW